MNKRLISLIATLLLLPIETVQSTCVNNVTAPCQQIFVDQTGSKIDCLLNLETKSETSACMVDLDDVITQVNSNSSVQANNLSITDATTPIFDSPVSVDFKTGFLERSA